jgi:DNA-binding CsgD family transcriptional regulator
VREYRFVKVYPSFSTVKTTRSGHPSRCSGRQAGKAASHTEHPTHSAPGPRLGPAPSRLQGHRQPGTGRTALAERARDEADRVSLHPTTSELTATEGRVAELVGSGRSNQETAAELFMSVRTVEAKLTRIYRKLSVRTRTELAIRMGGTDPAAQP